MPRSVVPGTPHHVVLRGNNRRRLFSYPREYEHFLSLLRKQLQTGQVSLQGYCLMSNHVHLLLTPMESRSLSNLVKPVAQRYAQVRNKRFNASGKLFEQRYFSKPMKSEAQLAITTVYIDLNPVRAGLTKDPCSYAWSSFGFHAGLPAHRLMTGMLTASLWYDGLGTDAGSRVDAYRAYAVECLARDDWADVRKDPPESKGSAPTRPNRSRAAT